MILHLYRESQNVSLKMNMKKTKLMFNIYTIAHEIRIDDEVIECVQEYNYLGQKIGTCPDHEN